MLTAEGCRRRRQRLLEQLSPAYPLVLADPIHLRYLAGYHVEAINQHADFGGLLVLTPDGECHLYHDSRLPATTAHADRIEEVVWYDGKSPGQGPRRLLFEPIIRRWGNRVHDLLPDPMAIQVHQAIAALRRCKDEDELTLIQQCLRASEVGHAWACRNLRVGLSELEIYNGLTSAIYQFLGQWAVVYGDFVVSRGGKRGGPPGLYRLQDSDAFILDYSVVLYGYRSDCTNTLICGNVTPRHTALFSACLEALQAGEAVLRAGVTGQQVYAAVHEAFRRRGLEAYFTTHAGHGLGLMHPEPPFFVPHSSEPLQVGDVVTLEPGLYCDDVGMRFEHVYRITENGCQRLSYHELRLQCASVSY